MLLWIKFETNYIPVYTVKIKNTWKKDLRDKITFGTPEFNEGFLKQFLL